MTPAPPLRSFLFLTPRRVSLTFSCRISCSRSTGASTTECARARPLLRRAFPTASGHPRPSHFATSPDSTS
jgi:hypothetical protein